MLNIYQTHKAGIISVSQESVDTKLFRLEFVDSEIKKNFHFLAGQFVQIGLPGWGECPISICSSPNDSETFFELAIRDVGVLTNKLNSLSLGDCVDIRGPFGNGFDVDLFKGKPLLLVGGGCGFVPLRPLIIDYLAGRLESKTLQILYGCASEETMLFKNNHAAWNRRAELKVILEKPSTDWKGDRGLVTDLFGRIKISAQTVAVLVGPPVMYRFVIKELKRKKLSDENIILSLEKRMHCGIGVCQHCAIGPFYVCKDGPVFRWLDIKDYYSL